MGTRYMEGRDRLSQQEAADILHQIEYAADDVGLKAAAYAVANVADVLDSPLHVSDDVIRAQLQYLLPSGKRGRVRLVLAGKSSARVYLAAAEVLKRLLGSEQ